MKLLPDSVRYYIVYVVDDIKDCILLALRVSAKADMSASKIAVAPNLSILIFNKHRKLVLIQKPAYISH